MIRTCRAALATLTICAAMGAQALEPCTQTINPGANVRDTVTAAAAGAVICLNPGSYSPPAAGFPADPNVLVIANGVTLQGMGASPAQVMLQGGANGSYAVWVVDFVGGKTASGLTISNLTIQGSQGGLQIDNFAAGGGQCGTTYNDITLRDVVINTTASANNRHGLLACNANRLNLDNVTINTTHQTSIAFYKVTNSLVMNSTVTNAVIGQAAAFFGGSNNVIVNNTFGQPKVGPSYSFTGTGNTVFYNSTGNRFEGNLLQGHTFDALDFAVTALPFGIPLVASTENYAGKNRIISTGLADGLGGGTGIWSNCRAHLNWIYGNHQNGAVEGGVTVWTSSSNMVLANTTYGNGIAGVMVSGGTETPGDCANLGYLKPNYNYAISNAAFFNKNDQTFFRDVDNTTVARNFVSPRNGVAGALAGPCVTEHCQSGIGFDSNLPASTGNVNMRVVANTNHENIRGFDSFDGKTTGIEFALNRNIQPNSLSFNRLITGAVLNFDAGSFAGGNYWSVFPGANANPSVGAPYGTAGHQLPSLGVFYNSNNNSGNIVDRYPFRDQHMGRAHTVTVTEPFAGGSFARGSMRTVRWNAPGCVYLDLSLDGTTSLSTNAPNTGYAIVTIPDAATIAAHSISVTCKDSSLVARGSGVSPTFNVTSSNLRLLAPGRDDTFNTGASLLVAWKKTTAVTSVAVDLSTNGGGSWSTLQTGLTGTFARITIPGTASVQNAMVRVRSLSTSDVDWTDGVFAIRGTTGAGFTNVPGGRQLQMGAVERLEWASPQNSRMVDITATVGGTTKAVATNLPDRGFFDWVMPEFPVGTVTLSIQFRNAAGGALGAPVNNVSAVSRYSTTITYNGVTTLGIGGAAALNPAANSGLAVTMSSLTPATCSVSGGNVNGVADGTCTITFNQAGNSSYAASNARTSFTVQADPPRLANIATRMQVLTGSDVMIGGFIIGGSSTKTVVVRARGPSLTQAGVPGALQNPQLQLFQGQTVIASNDDWGSATNAAAISASGFAPSQTAEAAILINLAPGAYTAIVSGVGGTTGVGIVEVFEVDATAVPLRNIATRGQVLTGSNVLIGGFIVQGSGTQQVVIRARGPSLTQAGVPGALPNPQLQIFQGQTVIASNDDWQTNANAAAISASGFAPSQVAEAAVLITLGPGAYTAIVSGVGGATGVGIVEVFTVP